jgi:hypothetical protein
MMIVGPLPWGSSGHHRSKNPVNNHCMPNGRVLSGIFDSRRSGIAGAKVPQQGIASVIDDRKLERLVDQYQRRFAQHRQAERQRFAGMPDLATAIREAALARRADGKCEVHQRRVGLARLEPFEKSLQATRQAIARCRSFDELHTIVERCRTERVGPLAVYDAAVRIAAYLSLAPDKIYLHTGTRKGAKALGLDTSQGHLNPDQLPRPLRRLSPDEIEDFLCIFKGSFRGRQSSKGCPSRDPGRKGISEPNSCHALRG